MTPLIELAHAKVNLYLHITGRRDDGYHLLDSLFVYVELADALALNPAASFGLRLEGTFAPGLETGGNIVERAAALLAAELGITPSGELSLQKNIPVAAGLGGGSADAAAALRALPKLWRKDVPRSVLERVALELGADVPAALDERPVYAHGIGELRRPAGLLPEFYLVLVNPGVPLNTAAVFTKKSTMNEDFSNPIQILPDDFEGFTAALREARNDLEPAALVLQPVIGEVLRALRATPGCRLARLTGSGATCFGLFQSRAEAEAAALSFAIDHGWWAWAGGLRA